MNDLTDDAKKFLEHYGVKGMRWGVRSNKVVGSHLGRDLTKADVNWKKKALTTSNYIKINNRMSYDINAFLPSLNKKYDNKDLGFDPVSQSYNTKAGKSYLKEFETTSSSFAKKAAEEILGVSPSGNWTASASVSLRDGLYITIEPTELKQTSFKETENGVVILFPLSMTSDNFISEIKKDSLKQSDLTNLFLSHYGVKGMRWGVSKAKSKRTPAETAIRQKRKSQSENRRVLSDGDIDKAIERLSKEKKLKDLVESDLTPGRKVVKAILSESGQKTLRTVASGAALYAAKILIDAKFGPTAASYITPKPKR